MRKLTVYVLLACIVVMAVFFIVMEGLEGSEPLEYGISLDE